MFRLVRNTFCGSHFALIAASRWSALPSAASVRSCPSSSVREQNSVRCQEFPNNVPPVWNCPSDQCNSYIGFWIIPGPDEGHKMVSMPQKRSFLWTVREAGNVSS